MIAYRSGQTGLFTSSTVQGSVSTPAGVLAGDVLVAFLSINGNSTVTITPPTGWTKIANGSVSGGYSSLWAFYKVATASEPTSYTFTASTGSQWAIAVEAWSNGNTSMPVDVYAVGPGGSGSTVDAPSVTTTLPNDAVIGAYAQNYSSSFTLPAKMTARLSRGGPNASIAVGDYTQATAGATGDLAATAGNAYYNIGLTVALRGANTAPNAPTLNSPPNNGTIDLNSPYQFGWTPSDADPGDSQSKFDLQYCVVGASTWTAVTATTPNAYWIAAANTFTAGNYEWQVRTYDSQGIVGPWSSSSFFTAAVAPPAPTFTAPVNGATIGTSSYTATISAPDVIASRWRTVADNAGSPDTSTIYSAAVTQTTGDLRSHTFTFPVNNRTEHLQCQVQNAAGLWSTWADSRNPISYTPPAAPTRALTGGATPPTVTVAITNPTPSGGQPAVAYNDIYVNDNDGTGWVRKATNVAANGTWVYRLPRSGVDFEPLIVVVAVATNGTTSASGVMS